MAPTISSALSDSISDFANKLQQFALLSEVPSIEAFLTNMFSNTLAYSVYGNISVVSEVTTSDDRNVAGLATAIALANSLRTHMNTHAADGAEHKKGGVATPDIANFPVVTSIASDLATLKTLCLALFTAYAAHDVDAVGGTTYHNHAANAHTLVSALIPTTLAEAITRLTDLKVKYKAHFVDAGTGAGAPHTASTGPDEGVANPANGNAVTIADAAALSGDKVSWAVISGGAGPKTGVSASAGNGIITFTASAPPVSDMILSYSLFRTV